MGDGGVEGEAGRHVQRVPLAELKIFPLCSKKYLVGRNIYLGQLGLARHDVAAGGRVVSHHSPVGRVVLPVGGRQLQELYRIGLDVYTCTHNTLYQTILDYTFSVHSWISKLNDPTPSHAECVNGPLYLKIHVSARYMHLTFYRAKKFLTLRHDISCERIWFYRLTLKDIGCLDQVNH